MHWKKLLIPLASVPVILLLAYGFRTDPKAIPSPLVQKAAPDFRLKSFGGGEVSLAALNGRPVVLNFWASWCYPACYEEAPLLEATWKRFADRGLMVLASLSWISTPTTIRPRSANLFQVASKRGASS